MKDRLDKNCVPIPQKDLDGLIKKGLIKMIGYDPEGRPIYTNTDLGNEIADHLEATEGKMTWNNENELYEDEEDDEDYYDDLDDEEDLEEELDD